ncbi:MAG: molybdenum cofactor guanylyltransferase MobA, partial [Burkholderiaceae bacterium]|nr:molybdenum cofactor guanylyltransferase MobA [Burkholderiaceae bacterium]
PRNLVAELGKALLREEADMAIAVTGDAPPFTPQPVFCLMKRELLPQLQAFLKAGGRKIEDWHATLKVAHAHFRDEDGTAFYNINTPEELEKLEKYK